VPYFAPLHPGRTLTTFGFVSSVVEILNALGVAMLVAPNGSEKRQNMGHVFMKTALIMQVLVMATFIAIAGVFHRRCIRGRITSNKVQTPLITLYTSTLIIMIRTVYRIVEHFGASRVPVNPGPDWDPMSLSPIVRYEWYCE